MSLSMVFSSLCFVHSCSSLGIVNAKSHLKSFSQFTQLPTMSFEGTPVLLHEVTYCRYVCICVKLKYVSAAPVAIFIAQAVRTL